MSTLGPWPCGGFRPNSDKESGLPSGLRGLSLCKEMLDIMERALPALTRRVHFSDAKAHIQWVAIKPMLLWRGVGFGG